MSEFDNFTQAFNGFLLSRAYSEEVLQENAEYRERNERQNSLYNQLKAFLPGENEDSDPYVILRECIDNNTYIVTLGLQNGYRQGFAEGVKFILQSLMLE